MAISGDTAARPASATTNPCLIPALHARYEKAWEEHNALDHARLDLDPKKGSDDRFLDRRYDEAMSANMREVDALRRAILHQVPIDGLDAMLLMYHIYCAHGLEDDPAEADKQALSTAIDTLFDFMACEDHHDHEALGQGFKAATMIVFDRRRYRTGLVED